MITANETCKKRGGGNLNMGFGFVMELSAESSINKPLHVSFPAPGLMSSSLLIPVGSGTRTSDSSPVLFSSELFLKTWEKLA